MGAGSSDLQLTGLSLTGLDVNAGRRQIHHRPERRLAA